MATQEGTNVSPRPLVRSVRAILGSSPPIQHVQENTSADLDYVTEDGDASEEEAEEEPMPEQPVYFSHPRRLRVASGIWTLVIVEFPSMQQARKVCIDLASSMSYSKLKHRLYDYVIQKVIDLLNNGSSVPVYNTTDDRKQWFIKVDGVWKFNREMNLFKFPWMFLIFAGYGDTWTYELTPTPLIS